MYMYMYVKWCFCGHEHCYQTQKRFGRNTHIHNSTQQYTIVHTSTQTYIVLIKIAQKPQQAKPLEEDSHAKDDTTDIIQFK